jgi:hypothetical protein
MVQWYGRLPAEEKMIGALSWPGPIGPVSKSLPVAVWAITSALCQMTLCPTFTEAGSGENDMSPEMPLIVTVSCAGGVGVGPGVGVGVGPGVGVGAGVGPGVGVGAGPVVPPPGDPIGGGAEVGSGRGAGGVVGVAVGDGDGVGFGAGVGEDVATGGVLATGDESCPHPESTSAEDARMSATSAPMGRLFPRGRREAGARRPRPTVSTPCPGSSTG